MQSKLNTVGGVCEPKIPQVTGQVQQMEKVITRLAEVCEQVETRIGGILMPAPTAGVVNEKDFPVAVPLAQELERLTNRINGITSNVESMLSRVEL